MFNTNKSFIVMSASKSECTAEENSARCKLLTSFLTAQGYEVTPAVGVTKDWGTEESVVVQRGNGPNWPELVDSCTALALSFQQDAVLYTASDRYSMLLSCKDSVNWRGASVLQLGRAYFTRELPEGCTDYTKISDGFIVIS